MTKRAFLFPGQGAQYPGMGKDFYDTYSVSREAFEEADDLLRRSLSRVIFSGPQDTLTETKNSQTAIFVTSVAILRALNQQLPQITPSVCAGLSLGEYAALHAAGYLDFADALQLVDKRAFFMNDACEKSTGTMAVILGLSAEAVSEIVKRAQMPRELWAANFNCPGQVVISGTKKGVEIGCRLAKEEGAKGVIPLNVHGAFHSGLMNDAEEKLKPYIEQAPLRKSSTALVQNATGNAVSDLEEIKKNLIMQVTHSVLWEAGVRAMEDMNVDEYLEIGCGKALSGFNRKIGVRGIAISIEKVPDFEKLEQKMR